MKPLINGLETTLKLIIAGSRNIDYYTTWDLNEIIISKFKIYPTEIVCGLARGPDLLGRTWAMDHKVPIKEFPANWDQFGKQAGFIRNVEMSHYADYLLALWDGQSNGTRHMISAMNAIKKPFHVELCE